MWTRTLSLVRTTYYINTNQYTFVHGHTRRIASRRVHKWRKSEKKYAAAVRKKTIAESKIEMEFGVRRSIYTNYRMHLVFF